MVAYAGDAIEENYFKTRQGFLEVMDCIGQDINTEFRSQIWDRYADIIDGVEEPDDDEIRANYYAEQADNLRKEY